MKIEGHILYTIPSIQFHPTPSNSRFALAHVDAKLNPGGSSNALFGKGSGAKRARLATVCARQATFLI